MSLITQFRDKDFIKGFNHYNGVQFYRVGSKIIEQYENIKNLKHISYEKFKEIVGG